MFTTICFSLITLLVIVSICLYFKLEPSKRDKDFATIIYIEVFMWYFLVGYIVFAG